jgi:polar amino acid transport system substrate-binding protein
MVRFSRLFRPFVLWCLLWLCAAAPGQARELKIIFSQYTPPYVFEDKTGIVVDIVRAALEPAGYSLQPVYVPIGRGFELFAQKRVDGTAIIRENSGLAASYSDNFMQYHNRVFALKSRQVKLRKLDDLKGRSIVAFQNAHKYLGEAFGAAMVDQPGYKEIANQETQVLMLLLGRVDLAIMDESIFRYYFAKAIHEGKVPAPVEYEVFDLFEPTPYKTAFTDPRVRDDFNRGLAVIRRNGQYDAIYRKYVDEYFPIKQ